MVYKFWIQVVLATTLALLFIAGGINYLVDPMWCFDQANSINSVQDPVNERQQKTNYITFREVDSEAVLLGSSRTTYINQNDFPMKTFNYSVSAMLPREWQPYLEYAVKQKGEPFNVVVIGFDYSGAFIETYKSDAPDLTPFVNISNPWYRYMQLLSFDVLRYSARDLFMLHDPDKYTHYNRYNVKHMAMYDSTKKNSEIINEMKGYSIQYAEWEYDPKLADIYKDINNHKYGKRFVVFAQPVSILHLASIKQAKRTKVYYRWLTDIVNEFGGIYNFMYPNSITYNLENYKDSNHFTSYVGSMIVKKMFGIESSDIPDDFGIYVTKEELPAHIEYLERLFEKIPINQEHEKQ